VARIAGVAAVQCLTRVDAAMGLASRTLYVIAPNHGVQPTTFGRG